MIMGIIYVIKIIKKIGEIDYGNSFKNNKYDVILESYEKEYHKIFLGIAKAIEKLQGQNVLLVTYYDSKPNRRKIKK